MAVGIGHGVDVVFLVVAVEGGVAYVVHDLDESLLRVVGVCEGSLMEGGGGACQQSIGIGEIDGVPHVVTHPHEAVLVVGETGAVAMTVHDGG